MIEFSVFVTDFAPENLYWNGGCINCVAIQENCFENWVWSILHNKTNRNMFVKTEQIWHFMSKNRQFQIKRSYMKNDSMS